MTSPITYQKPKRGRLVVIFALSIGAHVALAAFLIWVGAHLPRPPQKPEDLAELGMDVVLGPDVQELIVAQNNPPTPEPPPPEPPPPPPEPTPPEPETPPEPMEKPDFVEPKPEPKATPAPKPKPPSKAAPAPPGAKVGPTPRAGVVGGNVAQGATTGTPGGQKVGATGWITPRGPYPDAAARAHIQGTLLIRVSTDASGRIVEAVVTRPADPLLDAAARTMARSIWKGPPNSSKTVTVIYKM